MTALGLASRREADEWIEAGWVRVNGKLAVLGQRVGPEVQITIDPAASSHPLGVWDGGAQRWALVDGEHTVYVGTSSRDLPLRAVVAIRATPQGQR